MTDHSTHTNRPNVLLIMADDLGQGDVSAFNPNCGWNTVFMDQLAAAGMKFFDSHATSSLCTPSRYGLITGRYNWRSRLKSLVLPGDSESLIEKDRYTMPKFLSDKGYRTAVVGKWHLGLDWQLKENGPDLEGFGLNPDDYSAPQQPRMGRDGFFDYSTQWEIEGTDIDYSKPITFGPNELGFDYSYITAASLDQPPYVYIENGQALGIPTEFGGDQLKLNRASDAQWQEIQKGPMVPGYDVSTTAQHFHDKALEVLDDFVSGEEPWFLYVPHHLVHGPIIPNERWQGRSSQGPYGDFVLQFDEYVGELVAKIDAAGQADNTIVIVTSDNGPSPVAGLDKLRAKGHDPANGWRGEKSDIWEGGHREPTIVRWPEVIDAGTTSQHLISHSDVFATLAEVLGENLPEDAAEDSISALATWKSSETPTRDVIVSSSGGGGMALRHNDWKLEFVTGGDGFNTWRDPNSPPTEYRPAQLYNLANDPAEENNLIEKHPDVVQELTDLLAQQIRDGRSTPGSVQRNDPASPRSSWRQIAWMSDATEVMEETRADIPR